MALQHAPDTTLIEVELPDETKTAFSFGEYLDLLESLNSPIQEHQRAGAIAWLMQPDNTQGRISAWSHVVKFRKLQPENPAVKFFREYAIENEIVI